MKQGDPLSPFLFNLVLDGLLEKANLSLLGVRFKSGRLAALAYADDLLLFAENDNDLQALIDITTRSASAQIRASLSPLATALISALALQ